MQAAQQGDALSDGTTLLMSTRTEAEDATPTGLNSERRIAFLETGFSEEDRSDSVNWKAMSGQKEQTCAESLEHKSDLETVAMQFPPVWRSVHPPLLFLSLDYLTCYSTFSYLGSHLNFPVPLPLLHTAALCRTHRSNPQSPHQTTRKDTHVHTRTAHCMHQMSKTNHHIETKIAHTLLIHSHTRNQTRQKRVL